MALEEIDLPRLKSPKVPPDIARLVEESDKRIDEFFHTERNKRYPQFIPSHPEQIYEALEYVTREKLPLGNVFCEWGSGFGVATCLAAMMGYEATGIEIETELIELSRKMAADLGVEATFLETSYIPEGLESFDGVGGSELFTTGLLTDAPTSFIYEGMDHEIEDIDVFFVYPWPTDQEFMMELFDTLAAEGAIMIFFYDAGEVTAFRRVADD